MNKSEDLVEKAHLIAEQAHKGQVDIAGKEYILHPEFVASLVEGWEEKCVAYLHDVLEDSDVTELQLRTVFPDSTVDAVKVLTRKKDEQYMQYIRRIKQNSLACTVKKADLFHNMMIERISNPSQADYFRIEKYKEAMEYLNK